jgi:type IV secretory pathway VirB4 component
LLPSYRTDVVSAGNIHSLGQWFGTRKNGSVMPHSPNPLTFFARTTFRNQHRLFGIKQADRRAHMYIIGKTGTGKSTLLETLIRQNLTAGEGLALLDPHGDLVERVVATFPEHRKADVLYFNVPDQDRLLGFNPLEHIPQRNAPSPLRAC